MARLVARPGLLDRLSRSLARAPVTLLLGPRQCGKTTLARELARGMRSTYLDLEDPETPLRHEAAKPPPRGDDQAQGRARTVTLAG